MTPSGPKKQPGRKSAVAPYRNAAFSAEKRAKDLLSRMTLEEKAAQMLCIWQQKPQTLVDADGRFDLAKAKKYYEHVTAYESHPMAPEARDALYRLQGSA